jgi:hypothetical protein
MIINQVYDFGISLMVMCLTRKKKYFGAQVQENKNTEPSYYKCLEEKVI